VHSVGALLDGEPLVGFFDRTLELAARQRGEEYGRLDLAELETVTLAVRDDLHASYYAFLAAFREAAKRLKAGILPVVFPAGSFPPALPFVGG
jgi:hypothetical protein